MKKLFMIAAAAALAIGMGSCVKNPDTEPNNGDGTKTEVMLSIVMPSGNGGTRADFPNIVATDDENKLKSIDVWMFDKNGNRAEGDLHHKTFTVGGVDPDFVENNETPGLFEMKKAWETLAGEVRIWVGANIPDNVAEEYANETALLAKVEDVVNMSDVSSGVKGLTFFSNATPYTLAEVPAGSVFESQPDTFNRVPVVIYRTVSKVVATNAPASATSYTLDWNSVRASEDSGLKLTYSPVHWYMMQRATKSWAAPNYDVLYYTTSAGQVSTTRPTTYLLWEETGTKGQSGYSLDTNISQYANDTDDFDTDHIDIIDDDDIDDDEDLSAIDGTYIGENVRMGAGANGARNEKTSYTFLSTTVSADKEVYWDGAIKWRAATPYGNVTAPTSIFLIKYKGTDYITSDKDNADAIINGIAQQNAYYLVDAIQKLNPADADPKYVGNPAYDGSQYNDAISGTPIMGGDYEDMIDFHVYEFHEGYVHFMFWLNEISSNQYEVLRNQFIHIETTGMNPAMNGTFAGYPGTEADPRIPINPMEMTPNNPDYIDGGGTVDPTKTKVVVNVTVNDWTYRKTTTVIGE
jgi:hypothetical protein